MTNTPKNRMMRGGNTARSGTRSAPHVPLAVVLGGFDVVRAVALAGIPVTAWVPPGDAVRRSRRLAAAVPPWVDPAREPVAAVDALLRFAAEQERRLVLLAPNDMALAFVSRHRDALSGAYALSLAGPELVEDLLDKDRFAALAAAHDLPVPPTRRLDPATGEPAVDGLRFPVVVKPLLRGQPWRADDAYAKAVLVDDAPGLRARWPGWRELGAPLLAQEAVPGPESRMESFHVHVDRSGAIAGAFTGRKIRTLPRRFGESTAVEITAAEDVARAGADIVARLGLRGPAKLDFKRADDGSLHLLEVNPRLTLWNLPGALAGVNLAAMAYADALGRPLPRAVPARPGVTWSDPPNDLASARQGGEPVGAWLRWTARCDAWSGFAADDPGPYLRERVLPALRRRLPGRG